MNDTQKQIAMIPLPIVTGAYIQAFGGNVPATKAEMVSELAGAVEQGRITIAAIKSCPPATQIGRAHV